MRRLYPAGPSVANNQTTKQPPDYSASPDFFVGPIGLFEIWRSAISNEGYETTPKEDDVFFLNPEVNQKPKKFKPQKMSKPRNKRVSSVQAILGPSRGDSKQSDIATWRLNRPKGRFSEITLGTNF